MNINNSIDIKESVGFIFRQALYFLAKDATGVAWVKQPDLQTVTPMLNLNHTIIVEYKSLLSAILISLIGRPKV